MVLILTQEKKQTLIHDIHYYKRKGLILTCFYVVNYSFFIEGVNDLQHGLDRQVFTGEASKEQWIQIFT